ncbi:dihydrodipicolinate synthase family protein [Chelativorans sp.]|uniref:dihydrodipicolinate synthase family protein n=1 Tax=Chelativorans sp. TaxID=2203393 RepID=UPI002810DFDA|nr:dihydrodipicolinate synthase family protein [Chelativorans sp.]
MNPTRRGVFPMLPTPFDGDGKLALAGIPALVAYIVESGADGLALLGLAGEVRALSIEGRKRVAEAAARALDGRLPMLIGTSCDRTRDAVDVTQHAVSLGAEIIMVAPPVAERRASEDDLLEHYLSVSRAAGNASVMLQDAPAELGVELSFDLITRIVSRAPNVRYAKLEGPLDGQSIADLREHPECAHLAFFGGKGGLRYIDVLDAGGSGMIPAAEAPERAVAVQRLYDAGDRAGALAAYRRMLPLWTFQAQSLAIAVASVKQILAWKGLLKDPYSRIAPALKPWSREALRRHALEAEIITSNGSLA